MAIMRMFCHTLATWVCGEAGRRERGTLSREIVVNLETQEEDTSLFVLREQGGVDRSRRKLGYWIP